MNNKKRINIKNMLVCIVMIIIIVGCVILLVHFCQKSISDLNKETTTIKKNETEITSEVKKSEVGQEKTTRLQTGATHTTFDTTQKPANNSNSSTPSNSALNNGTTKVSLPTTTTAVLTD